MDVLIGDLFKYQKFTGPTIFAGFPATKVYAGTSLVTTAPAATMHHSPKVTPHKIVALAPIEAPYLTTVSRRPNLRMILMFRQDLWNVDICHL